MPFVKEAAKLESSSTQSLPNPERDGAITLAFVSLGLLAWGGVVSSQL